MTRVPLMADVIDFFVVDGAAEPKPSPRRLTMLSALATGWLPWGIETHPSLTFSWDENDRGRATGFGFILCCGHTMKPKEAQQFVSAGLLQAGKTRHGEEGLVITEAGQHWLERNWIS